MSLHGRKRTASGGGSLTTTPVMGATAAPVSIPDLSLTGDPAHPSCFALTAAAQPLAPVMPTPVTLTAPATDSIHPAGYAGRVCDSIAVIPPVIKSIVWRRYVSTEAGICYGCRSAGITPVTFECAYLVPEAGPRIENLRPVCGGCASAVAGGSLTAFIEKYGLHK